MQIQIFTDDDNNSRGFIFASTKNAFAISFNIGESMLKLNPCEIKTAKMILCEFSFQNNRRRQISRIQTLVVLEKNAKPSQIYILKVSNNN